MFCVEGAIEGVPRAELTVIVTAALVEALSGELALSVTAAQ